jgi:hypothetical protein
MDDGAPQADAPLNPAFGRIPTWLPFAVVVAASGAATVVERIPLPGDATRFAAAGAAILSGDLSSVYADTWMQGGPLELLGSLAWLPLASQHPDIGTGFDFSGYPVLTDLTTGLALALCVLGCVTLARRGTGLRRSVWPALAALAAAAVTRLPAQTLLSGHLAQPMVALGWVGAAVLAFRGRAVAAALALGLCSAWEPWALLAVPVLLLDPRLDLRRVRHGPRGPLLARGAVVGVVFVVATVAPYLPFAATGHFALFEHRWPFITDSIVGHLMHRGSSVTWPWRLAQGGFTIAAGTLVVQALRARRDVVWLAPFAIQVARLLLDPLQLSYYWIPLLVLSVVGVGMLPPTAGRRWVGIVVALLVLPQLQSLDERTWAPSSTASVGLLATAAVLVLAVVQARAGSSTNRNDSAAAPNASATTTPALRADPVPEAVVPTPRPGVEPPSAASAATISAGWKR